jgi:hypothetical protein
MLYISCIVAQKRLAFLQNAAAIATLRGHPGGHATHLAATQCPDFVTRSGRSHTALLCGTGPSRRVEVSLLATHHLPAREGCFVQHIRNSTIYWCRVRTGRRIEDA